MGAGGSSIDTQYRSSYTTIVEKHPLVNLQRENRMSENSYLKFRVGAVQAGPVFMDRGGDGRQGVPPHPGSGG
jgi:hypothetical protein